MILKQQSMMVPGPALRMVPRKIFLLMMWKLLSIQQKPLKYVYSCSVFPFSTVVNKLHVICNILLENQ